MAKLIISEHFRLAGVGLIEDSRPLVEQVVTYTTSTQSAAFDPRTKFVHVISDAKVHISFGTNPTATANNRWIPADTSAWFGVRAGDKLAAYDGTSV